MSQYAAPKQPGWVYGGGEKFHLDANLNARYKYYVEFIQIYAVSWMEDSISWGWRMRRSQLEGSGS